ncbi:complex I NDUFA9 subunit family protein [Pseudooceanicola nanhaiensis]|uniref:complex I NDUFA9 subunit family protein n=1 Tax=Pseudooceanicola nanhaiensis TaxID=375761 RepID=UPI001CD79CC6|nr:complex I NDUFA9 subunit family protein [Pseudooceanicola nanhaiensis]MCA0920491.1 complex I NDUFA9 subunit family protein [Pseudooceanicola nanhaiensis]
MAKLVTIFGGSGFIGRYVARRMAQDGWRVRVAMRRPNEAGFVRTYGNVGQVEPVFCNIRDDDSVRAVTRGADAVVNCVGVLVESGKNSFDAVQGEAPGRIARIAAEEGVASMVHLSAVGADAESASAYARTKAAGEEAVQAAFPGAVILRPSVVFGPEDEFFNRFAAMATRGPVLPVVGGDTKFQPVFADDVAAAAQLGAEGKAGAGIYELGGPDVVPFRKLMQDMLAVIRRKRIIVNMPFAIAGMIGGAFDLLQKITGGLLTNKVLTRDQVRNLKSDNMVSEGAKGFADLGISPVAYEAVLSSYLWRYRESGQYSDIKNSARNLNV